LQSALWTLEGIGNRQLVLDVEALCVEGILACARVDAPDQRIAVLIKILDDLKADALVLLLGNSFREIEVFTNHLAEKIRRTI